MRQVEGQPPAVGQPLAFRSHEIRGIPGHQMRGTRGTRHIDVHNG